MSFKYWVYLAICIFAIVSAAAIFWIKDHPFAYDGDEAMFIDTAYQDVYCVKNSNFFHFLRTDYRYNLTDYAPASRLLALPATLTLGPSPFILHLTSWFYFSLTVLFIYLTAKNLCQDRAAGAFAVIFMSLCPMNISLSKLFMTEPSLNLGIAMLFYFCFKDWVYPRRRVWGWLGLGIALGLGILAKISFVLIACPVLLMMLWSKIFRATEGLSLSYLLKAFLVGLVMAFDWYRNNLYDYLYLITHVTTHNVRHSFGVNLALWEKLKIGFIVFTESETGPYLWALTVLFMLIVIIRRKSLDERKKLALWVCFLSMIPTLFVFFGGVNNNSRYLSPILIPLAVAFGVMASEIIGSLGSMANFLLAGVMLCQLLIMVVPDPGEPLYKKPDSIGKVLLLGDLSTVFEREDQWDWDPLKRLCDQRHIKDPSIYYIGNGLQLKNFTIKYPWQKRKEHAYVYGLGRYDDGPIDWKYIFALIHTGDVVLTAPTLKGYAPNKDYLDNLHNVEFIKRLEADPLFEGPVILTMGKVEPEKVYVFFRKSHR